MSFTGNNFMGSAQPQLSTYLHGSNHFQKNYCSQQTPAYPLFHSAAMAAMAAAAAANYSQFGTRLTNGPLNLTSAPGYRGGAYAFNETDENRGSYYSGFGLSNNLPYANTYTNGFPNAKHSIQFPFSSTPTFHSGQLDANNVQTFPVHTQSGGTSTQGATTSQLSTSMSNQSTPRISKSQGHKAGYKARLKKAINTQEMANRKRQEFDELVKARTDKLLSAYTNLNADPSSSTGSTGMPTSTATSALKEPSSSPNYKKLIEAVLDAKKSALLRSPSVVAYLETQQRSLAEFKRRTEMFCVDAK